MIKNGVQCYVKDTTMGGRVCVRECLPTFSISWLFLEGLQENRSGIAYGRKNWRLGIKGGREAFCCVTWVLWLLLYADTLLNLKEKRHWFLSHGPVRSESPGKCTFSKFPGWLSWRVSPELMQVSQFYNSVTSTSFWAVSQSCTGPPRSQVTLHILSLYRQVVPVRQVDVFYWHLLHLRPPVPRPSWDHHPNRHLPGVGELGTVCRPDCPHSLGLSDLWVG